MGHVDHGKTSLLDTLRKTNVAGGEAGGITQHIGAYSVDTPRGAVTFLDTPGHAAFTAMRARGAQVTDIVILVVAADDGVMPQTVEAIKHAKAAKVPIIVAVNKIDKPEAKPERVMQQLTEHGLVPEDWGGETMMVPVSARKGTGIDDLLERILLQADVLELRANPDRRAEGTIVEAELDKGRGPVATFLVQSGTLRIGDFIVAGEHAGKVRAMYNSRGEALKEAGPSTPVQVLGLSGVPNAGDRLNAVADDKTAKTVAEHRGIKSREEALKRQNSPMSNLVDFLGKSASTEEMHELRIIVKADVGGSAEALTRELERLSTAKVKVIVIQSGVGTITGSDVNQAIASRALVIGFNSKPDAKAQITAAHEKVDVRTYGIIYEVVDDVKKVMAQLLAPKLEERYLGRAEVRALFSVPKLGLIAGSYVVDGKIVRTEKVRVRRGTAVVHEGNLASLKRFKDDAKEVAAGYECGIGFVSFPDVKEGDVVECYTLAEVAAELGEALVAQEERENEKKAGGASTQPSA
jgi:translation initiation factor IF-2